MYKETVKRGKRPDDLIYEARDLRSRALAQWVKHLIFDTPIEIFIGAVLVGSACGFTSYFNEAAKQGQIPLAYSEIGDIREDYAGRGKQVPVLTGYYAALNDGVMEVFEANNNAYAGTGSGSDYDFAVALNEKRRGRGQDHARLRNYAGEMPVLAAKALDTVSVFDAAVADIAPAIKALDDAWNDYHRDVYRTEYYTTTKCDTGGKNCRSVTETRQVYDYTIHTYDYYPEHGKLAVALLRDFVEKHPDIKIDERMLVADHTYDDNKRLIRESRKDMPGFEALSEDDYVALSNVWSTGSNYSKLTPSIYSNHAAVVHTTPLWAAASVTAESHRYRTYSRYDSGPEAFQIAEAALDYAVSMARGAARITDGMREAETGLPALDDKVSEYVNAMLLEMDDYDYDEARDEIMDLARDLYEKNYAGGFDVYPAKWGMVVLWSVVGLLVGGGLGFGVDRMNERIQRGERLRDMLPGKSFTPR